MFDYKDLLGIYKWLNVEKKMLETLEMQEIPQNSEQNSEYVHISINYEPEKETRKISNRNLILAVVLSSILALGFVIFGVLWYNFSPTAADSNISRNELQQDTHERGTFKTKRFWPIGNWEIFVEKVGENRVRSLILWTHHYSGI